MKTTRSLIFNPEGASVLDHGAVRQVYLADLPLNKSWRQATIRRVDWLDAAMSVIPQGPQYSADLVGGELDSDHRGISLHVTSSVHTPDPAELIEVTGRLIKGAGLFNEFVRKARIDLSNIGAPLGLPSRVVASAYLSATVLVDTRDDLVFGPMVSSVLDFRNLLDPVAEGCGFTDSTKQVTSAGRDCAYVALSELIASSSILGLQGDRTIGSSIFGHLYVRRKTDVSEPTTHLCVLPSYSDWGYVFLNSAQSPGTMGRLETYVSSKTSQVDGPYSPSRYITLELLSALGPSNSELAVTETVPSYRFQQIVRANIGSKVGNFSDRLGDLAAGFFGQPLDPVTVIGTPSEAGDSLILVNGLEVPAVTLGPTVLVPSPRARRLQHLKLSVSNPEETDAEAFVSEGLLVKVVPSALPVLVGVGPSLRNPLKPRVYKYMTEVK